MTVNTATIGYPRIGRNREWKKAIESYWKQETTEAELHNQLHELYVNQLRIQKDKGIDFVSVGDFSYYDHMLDTAVMFNIIPARFKKQNLSALDTYYAMARGNKEAEACEMTKWFNTNYHYIVPEFTDVTPALNENRPLAYWQKAKDELALNGKPLLIGPATFILLGKGFKQEEVSSLFAQLTPLYIQVIKELHEAGAEWIQIDEPIFVTNKAEGYWKDVEAFYQRISEEVPGAKLIIQTYFEALDNYQSVVNLPVNAFGLDFVHDERKNSEAIKAHGFPKGKKLFAGVIDGRNVWKSNLIEKAALVSELQKLVGKEEVIVQPSSTLLHVPVTVETEQELPADIRAGLSFAEEKLTELELLKDLLKGDSEAVKAHQQEIEAFSKVANRVHAKTRAELEQIDDQALSRASVAERQRLQKEKFDLPLLPTTTIGSLPQTAEVRSKRLKWKQGQLTNEQYEAFIKEETKRWIEIQEEIGIDVLVHGEFERTDMVEFFGERLGGMLTTKNGWVQSYGSRCVRPPVVYGDVYLVEPMTVKEIVYAQSLTEKVVKGMLTGPITILNWSFPRTDISKYESMNQIALAIRKEVKALEEAGVHMIQVDEPALREGLPIRAEKQAAYLNATVEAFRLATTGVEDTTQIHTHMCYSKFDDMIDTISALDADVISIEASRSHGNIISSFEQYSYDKEIGLGIYDIHSPRIPSFEEMTNNLDRALRVLNPAQFWVNPDCGLKTRNEKQVIDALTQMVNVTKKYREKLAAVAQ
ncbi:5-methyltetrahydropteroyltriglutamate--homocysteine S-methyltransferase [Priestia flexa]|uniref:5-methyltetrahydropteroyltriglutamate-- homocysteine S-methyltransferase n=1 Tax=Priestia TaxID=2800373 RepID=UPI0011A75B05|nr:5-methyltetrahydropteroyltriglutamate--homocysteine S-methyltransferase [Priestia flexa]MCM3068098.1 5-methyltetrahydropteroyltriglutamate--homocysteine S-methyltransferase [Priestia flexa]